MKNIKAHILITFLVFIPIWAADAASNSYLKIDGSNKISNETSTTATATSGANTGTISTEPVPPPGGSRDIYLDIEDIEGDPTKKTEENAKIKQKVKEGESVNNWPISVNSREIRGWDAEKKQEFVVSVKTAAEVQSGQDLENFAKGILLKDENVEFVEANEENVKVTYKMPARFLGIFTTSLNVRAEVARNGTVKVALPWYSFLYKKPFVISDIKSDLEANLPELDDEVLVLFETRAKVITTLSTNMKTKHDTAKNSIGNVR